MGDRDVLQVLSGVLGARTVGRVLVEPHAREVREERKEHAGPQALASAVGVADAQDSELCVGGEERHRHVFVRGVRIFNPNAKNDAVSLERKRQIVWFDRFDGREFKARYVEEMRHGFSGQWKKRGLIVARRTREQT